MAKRVNSSELPARREVEWVSGLVSLPEYVGSDEAPYRPDAMLSIRPDGAPLGFVTGEPGELMPIAGQLVRDAMRRPASGPPHAPARIRVSNPVLAHVLRAQLPRSIEIVSAPTPELDAAFEALRARAEAKRREARSYLPTTRAPGTVAALFEAAQTLHDACPSLPAEQGDVLLSMTSEALEVRDALVCLTRREARAPALLLMGDREAYDRYVCASDASGAAGSSRADERPRPPMHLALRFVPSAALSTRERAEIAHHAWPLAHAEACPEAEFVDADGVAGPASSHELAVFEAAARAVAVALADRHALLEALRGGAPFEATIPLRTPSGEIAVTLRAPYLADRQRAIDVRKLLAELRALDGRDPLAAAASPRAPAPRPLDEAVRDEREDLDAELMIHFVGSREGRATEEFMSCQRVIELARARFGVSVARLEPAQLREIVFTLLPRDAARDGPPARGIVDALRAFYGFLKRMEALPQADACLAVLDGDAAARLERALRERRDGGLTNALAP